MKGYMAFIKKEFLEQLRTYRALILLSVFFLFGLMSPLTAKMLPEILSGMEMQGMIITLQEATAMDAYGQFFKNITQMGVVVLLLVFGGMLSNELTRGTLVNILAKGLGRHTVLLSKYTAALLLWTVTLVFTGLVNQGYTMYLFDTSAIQNIVLSLFMLWLFGAFLLALILLSSILTGGSFGGLILTATVLGGLLLLNIVPDMEKYNPTYLVSHNVELLSGGLKPVDTLLPIGITVGLIFLSIAASITLFRKRKL